jgi:ADP-ribosylglycohydrolase
MTAPSCRKSRQHFRGCLLGGAVGDALGAAVEFASLREIRRSFGPDGLTGYASAYGRPGAITDDTQMTLFTAEGLIRAANRFADRGICSMVGCVERAYLRWLHTQGARYDERRMGERGWLLEHADLHQRRAPGNTCLSALDAALRAGPNRSPARPAANDSKGCGGVMRVAPVGLVCLEPLRDGTAVAALTHGHLAGHWAAGYFALLIGRLADGASLSSAVEELVAHPPATAAPEVDAALAHALRLAREGTGTAEEVEQLGEGWVAEEALAIGVYAALHGLDSFRRGVLLAVNHGGDSDSTGSIAGNLLGLIHGEEGIPRDWLDGLELRDVITRIADDLWLHFGDGEEPRAGVPEDTDRYPPN